MLRPGGQHDVRFRQEHGDRQAVRDVAHGRLADHGRPHRGRTRDGGRHQCLRILDCRLAAIGIGENLYHQHFGLSAFRPV